ncbi:MAG: molybdenum cofactor cytidylyltransferase [Acidobacteriota bacterium]|jgi:CTP:molybdopterin cytidylyltransferase MocA|nr:molybdenum cofactor cytidylyltransferase [Acidobacteriota bacterium]
MQAFDDIAAVLLAAGRSRRMGAFKPLLPFGARSVVEACVTNLYEAGVSEVVIVVGGRGASVRAALAGLPYVRFAVNEETRSEMGVSLARGIEALHEDAGAVLIALVDQPAVPPETVKSLIEARCRTGARLVVPEWRGRGGHPVLIDLGFRAELLSLNPEKGLRGLFDAHRAEVLRVPVDSPFVVRDMDTWEDYVALHTEVFGTPPIESEQNRERSGAS